MTQKEAFVGIKEKQVGYALTFPCLLYILGIKACSEHIHEQIYKIPCIISYVSKTILEIKYKYFPAFLCRI